MIFNPDYYYVLAIHSCSESGSFGVSLDFTFKNLTDALIYCKYKNFWNEQSDGSNINEYYVKFDINIDEFNKLIDKDFKELYDREYVSEHGHGHGKSLIEFYDHDIDCTIVCLTYDIDVDYIYNVQLIPHDQKIQFLNEINDIIKIKKHDRIPITNLIKYIQLTENTKIDNYDDYCTIIKLFLNKASLYQIKTMKYIINDNPIDNDGELLIGSLLNNKSITLYELLNEKLISIENLLARSCNNNGYMLGNISDQSFEYVVQYLLGACDKYGKRYDSNTSNDKYEKLTKIINDTDNVKYESVDIRNLHINDDLYE
jgi:hypothetical protein